MENNNHEEFKNYVKFSNMSKSIKENTNKQGYNKIEKLIIDEIESKVFKHNSNIELGSIQKRFNTTPSYQPIIGFQEIIYPPFVSSKYG